MIKLQETSFEGKGTRCEIRGARFEVRGAILHRVLTPKTQRLLFPRRRETCFARLNEKVYMDYVGYRSAQPNLP